MRLKRSGPARNFGEGCTRGEFHFSLLHGLYISLLCLLATGLGLDRHPALHRHHRRADEQIHLKVHAVSIVVPLTFQARLNGFSQDSP